MARITDVCVFFQNTIVMGTLAQNQVEANLDPTESNDMTYKKIFPIKAGPHLLFNYHVLL